MNSQTGFQLISPPPESYPLPKIKFPIKPPRPRPLIDIVIIVNSNQYLLSTKLYAMWVRHPESEERRMKDLLSTGDSTPPRRIRVTLDMKLSWKGTEESYRIGDSSLVPRSERRRTYVISFQ